MDIKTILSVTIALAFALAMPQLRAQAASSDCGSEILYTIQSHGEGMPVADGTDAARRSRRAGAWLSVMLGR